MNLSKVDLFKAFKHRFFSGEVDRRLSALVADFRPDLAHIHNAYGQASASVFLTLNQLRVPIVLTLHDPFPLCPNPVEKLEEYYYGLRIWKHIRLFICPSEFMAKKMVEAGFPKEKMRVIRNPFPLPAHCPPPGTEVVYLEKSHDKKDLNKAKVVVVPANCHENCSFDILEAQSQGRIVVAPRGGGHLEFIIDGESGFLYRADEPESLAATVQKALSLTDEKASKIIERSRQLVLRDHNLDQYFRLLREVYEEALRH